MKDTSFDLTNPDVLSFLQLRNFISVGSFALLLYEYVLTLPQEISTIWGQSSAKTIMPWLFFLARYPPIVFFCLFAYTKPAIPMRRLFSGTEEGDHGVISNVQDWLFFVSVLAGCEGILLVRTWALWSCSRKMLWVLSVVYLGMLILAILMLLYPVWSKADQQQDLFAYATIAAVETLIIVLTIYRVVNHLRLRTARKLLKMVYRDGIVYYSCILTLSLMNLTLQLLYKDKPLLLSDLQLVIHSVLCTRAGRHLAAIPISGTLLSGSGPCRSWRG
jgi:hypothetical protein